MHPYAIVPLLAAVGSGALASAIGVRAPHSPTHRLAAAFLLVNALWALASVLWITADDAASALRFMRWGAVPALCVAPLAFHLILALRPALDLRYRRWRDLCYLATGVLAVLWLGTPFFVEAMARTHWGWSPVFGSQALLSCVFLCAAPLAAYVASLRRSAPESPESPAASPWLHASVIVPFGISFVADLILPWRGVHVPPLGSAAITLWGAAVWWFVYRFRFATLSPQRFAREILETLPNGVALLRVDGRIRTANPRLAELAGLPLPELEGRRIQSVLCETDRELPFEADGEVECELRTAAGDRIPVSASQSPLRDELGSTIGYVIAIRDLRELSSLRSRLVISGRLAAVGQLAAGIAHEVNNPLSYVRSNLGLLERHWDAFAKRGDETGTATGADWREGHEILGECREGVDRVAAIVRDVGGFAARGPAGLESADLNELLDAAVRVATPQLRGRAAVERSYGAIPRVECVPQELMQVFLNLVLNAVQSLEGRGSIRLVTEAENGRVRVRVEDDGRGIPEEAAARIFDPFFTTKPASEGTGLGLSISRQIVAKHGGEIGASPREGGGSVFWLQLPARGPDAEPA